MARLKATEKGRFRLWRSAPPAELINNRYVREALFVRARGRIKRMKLKDRLFLYKMRDQAYDDHLARCLMRHKQPLSKRQFNRRWYGGMKRAALYTDPQRRIKEFLRGTAELPELRQEKRM